MLRFSPCQYFAARLIFTLFFVATIIPCSVYAGEKRLNVLVVPFQNTGPGEFSWIAAGMTDSVMADLGRISEVQVVSQEDRKRAMEEIALQQSGLLKDEELAKVGNLLGAHVIFTGSYSVVADNIRIIARLVKVESGVTQNTLKLDGPVKNLFDLQDRVATGLLKETSKIALNDVKLPDTNKISPFAINKPRRPVLSAYTLYYKGIELQDTDPAEAMKYFAQAIMADPQYRQAYKNAGYTWTIRGDAAKALGFLKQSLQLHKDAGDLDSADYADLLVQIGGAYYMAKDYDEALKWYAQAFHVYEKRGETNTSGFAGLLYAIGTACSLKADYATAMKYYDASRKIYENLKLQNVISYGHLLYGLGYLYLGQRRYSDALPCFLDAQAIYIKRNMASTRTYAGVLENIAYTYENLGDKKRALQYYEASLEAHDKSGTFTPDRTRVEGSVKRLKGGGD
ncbi:MAG: tetratricopeptide repeat protein [Spirochaetia bacterium]|nr:tetratricopeptide repeat protein [Spirochaetia bacterium]